MAAEPSSFDVVIVGAGLCGLMSAQILTGAGMRVCIVDKGRSVGGRLATRRIGPGRADHGAQFFSVRTPEFQTWVDRWQSEGLVFVWSRGWGEGSQDANRQDGYPRYAVHGGMNALAKWLTQALPQAQATLLTQSRIMRASVVNHNWQVVDAAGSTYTAPILVTTAPVPQSLDFLQAGDIQLRVADRQALAAIEYAPCLCLLIWTDTPVDLPDPGGRQTPDATVTWIADNQRKGISPEARVITAHASPEFSREYYDAPDAQVRELLWPQIAEYFGDAPALREVQVKRWRYALPTQTHDERFLHIDRPAPIYFGGDAFGGPRVEGAALSGLTIGRDLVNRYGIINTGQ